MVWWKWQNGLLFLNSEWFWMLEILRELKNSYGDSLEGLMLKLKLQYFGHLMQWADSFEKTLMLGKIEGGVEGDDRGWDGWMASLTQWTWVWVDSRRWWWTGGPGVLQSIGSQRVGHDWVTELNWTEVTDGDSNMLRNQGSSWSKHQTYVSCVSCIGRQILYH